MKTLQTVMYYRDETPMRGAIVIIDRKADESGAREEAQRFLLTKWEAREAGPICGMAFDLHWLTNCTECGAEMNAKTYNYTKSLPRRCAACKKNNPYDPSNWRSRPRNRYVRIDPEMEAGEAPADAAVSPLAALGQRERVALLTGVKADLGKDATREEVEAEALNRLSLF